MKLVLKIALGIVLGVVLLIGGCVDFWSITPLVSAEDLTTKWFVDNKGYLYDNEEYNVVGIVDDISEKDRTINLKGYDTFHYVKCTLSDESDIQSVSKGDEVKIKGDIEGNILTVIIMHNCEIKYAK